MVICQTCLLKSGAEELSVICGERCPARASVPPGARLRDMVDAVVALIPRVPRAGEFLAITTFGTPPKRAVLRRVENLSEFEAPIRNEMIKAGKAFLVVISSGGRDEFIRVAHPRSATPQMGRSETPCSDVEYVH